MRKGIVWVLLLLLAGFALVYFFVPSTLHIKKEQSVLFSAKAVTRNLMDEQTWSRWWPGRVDSTLHQNQIFTYNNNKYKIVSTKTSSLSVSIADDRYAMLTELVLIPHKEDSLVLEWVGSVPTSFDPFSRLQKKAWVKGVQKDMDTLLKKLTAFYAQEANLYTVPIRKDFVMDSTLISTAATFAEPPSTQAVYTLIDRLKAFAQQKGARQTGFPMLHVTKDGEGGYLTKVALPVDKVLQDEGPIQYRWMLGGGNILVAEVKGGPHAINQAFAQMEMYIDDFDRTAPAIPFQSLITDRRQEPDTSKWITKLYWPVM